MILRSASLIAVLSASTALAQAPIDVQSGEHGEFTRIVLGIDPARSWRLTPTETGYDFVLQGGGVDFDISALFTRINRARLKAANILPGALEGVLQLELACACGINAFAFEGQYLVLDIRPLTEGAQPEEMRSSPAATVAASPTAATGRIAPQLFRHDLGAQAPAVATFSVAALSPPPMIAPDSNAETAQNAPEPAPHRDTPAASDTMANNSHGGQDHDEEPYAAEPSHTTGTTATSSASPETSSPHTAMDMADADMEARIAEAQTALMEQLTRAAEQGLVDFQPIEAEPEPEPVAEPEPEIAAAPPDDPELSRQITATTVYDRDGASALADIVNTFARTHCVEDPEIDIAGWGGSGSFGEQLSTLHAAMVEERDRPRPDEAEDLARFYLRYGLGREARTVLDAYALAADAPLLLELAMVLDGVTPPIGGVLDKGNGCGGAHEMWRLIALADLAEAPPATVESVLAAFADLPIDLRNLVAPRLGNAFINREQVGVAARVLDLAERAGQPASDDLRLLRARLNLADNPASAEAELTALMTENAANSPEAMLLLARALQARGQPAPEDLVQSLGAAAFELRGSAMGRALRLAEISARAGAEGFDTALALVVADLGRDALADSDLRIVAAEIMHEALPNPAAPAQYAETIFRHRNLIPTGRDGDALRTRLAENMLSLALPDSALALLGDAPAHSEPAQLVAAQAQLARFAPQAALDMLAGRSDAAALGLIAAAHSQLGNHDAALDALEKAETAGQSRAEAAFLAGDWAQVDDAQLDGVEMAGAAELARYMALRESGEAAAQLPPASPAEAFLHPMPIDQPNTLEAARATLDANRASRAYLEALLNPDEGAATN